MDEPTRRRIFKPLFSTKTTGNRGIGLGIVSDITKRLGGRVEVQSEPGRGTTFCVYLPVRARTAVLTFRRAAE